MPFSAFTGEFAAALANARKGDIVKIAAGDAIQLMQVYRADKPSKHMQLATITYPVEASAATRRDIHNQAGSFMVTAKGRFVGCLCRCRFDGSRDAPRGGYRPG